jgi:hypothetical protein
MSQDPNNGEMETLRRFWGDHKRWIIIGAVLLLIVIVGLILLVGDDGCGFKSQLEDVGFYEGTQDYDRLCEGLEDLENYVGGS